jgi:hypothetical protein
MLRIPLEVSRAASCWFLVRLIPRSWILKQHVPPKRRLIFNGLHGVIYQNMELVILILSSHHFLVLLGSHFLRELSAEFHSSICLSRDRSIASSKLSSPKSAILSFLLQLPVSSCFLKVIQQLLTSPSSPSCLSNLSFNDVFYKAVPTQYVPNPVGVPSSYCVKNVPSPPSLYVILIHYLRGLSNLSSPSFSNTTFQNFPGTSDLVSEESKFPTYKAMLQM